uniref:Putative transporter ydeD n=1 Tax=Anthurium amnicola TaxID=1678845 RepID=A0A1D1XIH8_9ARAE
MAKYPLAIKVANVLVYFFLLGANVYSVFDRNDDSPYGKKETFISPAPFVFGIGGLIHFLLGGFVIYQWFGPQELVLDGINWHFVGISLLNTLWLVFWQTGHFILAWITILFTAGQITYTYAVITRSRESREGREDAATINELIWIHAPFSLYHAWIVVINLISIFAAFANDKESPDDKPKLIVKIFVVIGLFILKSTAIGYIFHGKGDIVGAIVIAVTLIGISIEQQDPVIHWVSLVLGVIVSLAALIPVYRRIRNRGEESAPLLG